ncbi:MAG: hypothetical protein AVDCRST_MAG05-3941 [uncultured Rubrobacteraceae bacterium]|uniref:Uncharacterized protein n=1 Tax=uncultured Rubrobacteraceae bacterium TaxID=349277 RepID=A0A6J4TKJ7_9ACTN|nr:MAG: hypothetical protein AVDCRST_MAG05-3941 [uncultured Rubrobacteraceae bacterium]
MPERITILFTNRILLLRGPTVRAIVDNLHVFPRVAAAA